MKLIIHRGAHQIGGSCVEVASETTRLILDAGLPLDPEELPVEPKVPGLFAPGSPIAAILLSHAHTDHSGLLPFTLASIPIYRTDETSKMLMAGRFFAKGFDLPRAREQRIVPGKPTPIGDFTVTAFSVGHSTMGAVAFLIEHRGRRLVYSGDLRLHGRTRGMLDELIANATGQIVDALLVEGTHFSREPALPQSEEQLEADLMRDIADAPGLVIAHFSPQHVERLVSFDLAATNAGRTFVPDLYTAYVMQLAARFPGMRNPARDRTIPVFTPRAQRGRPQKIRERFSGNKIGLDRILAEPQRYVLVARTSTIAQDFGSVLPPRTLYIYSLWHGYLDGPKWPPVRAALGDCGGGLIQRHTSGHAFEGDVVELVRALAPRVVVPIHTARPEAFVERFPNARLLPDGEALSLDEL